MNTHSTGGEPADEPTRYVLNARLGLYNTDFRIRVGDGPDDSVIAVSLAWEGVHAHVWITAEEADELGDALMSAAADARARVSPPPSAV
jgi:hypothetical protein